MLLIVDSNIIIDLYHGNLLSLLQKYTKLQNIRLLTSDFIEIEVARYLRNVHPAGVHGTFSLKKYGIKVSSLSGIEVEKAEQFGKKYPKISRPDASLIILIQKNPHAMLLTGDKALKKAVQSECGLSTVHGTLWLVEQFIINGLISPEDADDTFARMLKYGRRLPQREIQNMLEKYR